MFNFFSKVARAVENSRIGFVSAVVLCAGNSTRFGNSDENKQMASVLGKAVAVRTLEAFEDCEPIKEVVLVVRKNDIEKYRQKSLYVTRKNAVRLQRDEYFIADLIGLKVQDEDGAELGTVKDVIETGANDVYEVEMADGRSLLLPAIKQCILNVDVENGMMQVHVLEGLLDL